MKKIKKVLLLLIAFSFTLLLFNTQAYAVEYYEFEITLTDVTDLNDIQFSPISFFNQDLIDFLNEYGQVSGDNIYYDFVGGDNIYYDTVNDNFILGIRSDLIDGYDLLYDDGVLSDDGSVDTIVVGTHIFISNVAITFIDSWWDNIIDAIDETATALSSAASAGFGLIYDGVGLTALGSALVIPIGLGLVLGVFYLIIRMLPSVRL